MAYLILSAIACILLQLAGMPWLPAIEGFVLIAPVPYLTDRRDEMKMVSWYVQFSLLGAAVAAILYAKNWSHELLYLALLFLLSIAVGFCIRWLTNRVAAIKV